MDARHETQDADEISPHRDCRIGKPLWEVVKPETAEKLKMEFIRRIESDTLADAKMPDFKLGKPIKATEEFQGMVERAFKAIIYRDDVVFAAVGASCT